MYILRKPTSKIVQPVQVNFIYFHLYTSFILYFDAKILNRSEERSFVQQLCGWSLDPSPVHVEGSPTRKAAVALFHLKLRHAIKLLNDSNNSVVAMAIAGFTEQKNTLWRDLAHATCHKLTDPYIRAMFAFLMESDNNNYSSILVTT